MAPPRPRPPFATSAYRTAMHLGYVVLCIGLLPQLPAFARQPPDAISLSDQPATVVTPKVLAVVSDHGTGSSTYTDQLGRHQCMFSVGEPFGTIQYLASNDGNTKGLVSRNGDVLLDKNPKIEEEIKHQVKKKHDDWAVKLPLPSTIYNGLTADGYGAYLSRVAEHVCKTMPSDLAAQCDGSCVLVAKMFPRYFGGDTSNFNSERMFNAADPVAQLLFDKDSLDIWDAALAKMKNTPNVQMVVLTRDEQSRSLSNWRRFQARSDNWFNCDVNRASNRTVYEQSARAAGAPGVTAESCWASEAGTQKCLQTAVDLVGLTMDGLDLDDTLRISFGASTGASQATQTSVGVAATCDSGGWLTVKGQGTKVVPKHEVDSMIEEARASYKSIFDTSKCGLYDKFAQSGKVALKGPTHTLPDASMFQGCGESTGYYR